VLVDPAVTVVHYIFYGLSTGPDLFKWDNNDWYHVPVTSHADLTALAQLPAPRLAVSARAQAPPPGEGRAAVVRVANTGKTLAFQVRLKLSAGTKELLPVLWEDNYFTLLPGEARELDVSYPAGAGTATVEALAWNGVAVTAAVTR
jgi:exo-1,4-beta-D-glucosaminidase